MPDAAADGTAYRTLETGLSAALTARARGEPDAAFGIYAALRNLFPLSPTGWQHAASALLDSGRYDDADSLLDDALRLFPTDAAVAIDSAWVAHRRRDVPEAVRRWERVRDRFPDHPVGYTGAVVTLRDAGQLDAADALLITAADRFPADPAPIIEMAWMAMAKRDWADAMQRWETVRARFPQHFVGYTGAAIALRETGRFDDAEALLLEAIEKFPDQPQPWMDRAQVAAMRRGWEEAAQLWDGVRERFPRQIEAYIGSAAALRELHRYDAAGEVLAQALLRFPGNPSIPIDYAWLAHFTRDWIGAVERWRDVRRLFPGHAVGFVSGAAALREAGQPDAAEALLLEAETRFPDAPEICIELARLVQFRHDWVDAAFRWDAVRARFPDNPAGYLSGAVCLREQQRFEEADAILVDAGRRFTSQPGPLLERAWLTNRRGLFHEALPLWERIRREFPDQVMGFTGGALALRDSGKASEAETLLRLAQERFPDDVGPSLEYGWLAHTQGDLAEAGRRFTFVTERFPNEPAGFWGLARCLIGLGQFDKAEEMLQQGRTQFPAFQLFAQDLSELPDRRRDRATGSRAGCAPTPDAPTPDVPRLPPMPRPDPTRIDPVLRDFVMRFESLGGSAPGWEFGMVQRACGAEPIDLLRWADMPFEMLLGALEQRFVDVGMPDMTEMFAMADEHGALEYCTRDRRGMMEMRSFIAKASVPSDEIFAAVCRRLQFQAKKLIEDLQQGDRIVVYRVAGRSLTRDEMTLLHAAVRRFGNATLLLVIPADAAHSDGAVEVVAPGLLIGYINHCVNSPFREIGALPVDSWLAVLGNADAIRRGVAAEPPSLPTPAVTTAPAQIKLLLCGFHHAHQVGTIVSRLLPLRGRIQVERLDPGQDADAIIASLPAGRLAAADVYFEESMVGNRETKRSLRAALSGRCEVRSFQTPYMTSLWPFLGRDDRLAPEPPIYNGGRYANTDRIAASLAGLEMTDDALFDAYMELTSAAQIDMDALLAADLGRWQAEDSIHDVKLSAFLLGDFRERRLFTTPHERAAAVLKETVLQLLETPTLRHACDPETLRVALDRLTHGWLGSRQELPVHPRVAEHFGLRWWAPDLRYRMLGNQFTFRDYIVRYIRWSPWLA